MRSWLKMIRELTIRPKGNRKIRKSPEYAFDDDLKKPLSGKTVKEILSKSSDIVFREFVLQGKERIDCMLVVVDGLVDKNLLDQFILKPLMVDLLGHSELAEVVLSNVIQKTQDSLLPGIEVRKISKMEDAVNAVLSGDAVIFFGDLTEAIVIGARGWANRGVNEPEAESVVKGPHEGFSETLRMNTSLLRRKIKHPSLRLISLKLGNISNTDVVVTYIEKIASPDVVSEVLLRLSKIEMDAVLDAGYIEEMIEDNPYSPFPQIAYTERPDVLAGKLLEGKVGIMIDGTPIVLVVPAILTQFLNINEDYYERAMTAILSRFVRYVGAFIAVVAPSVYIAVTTFHQEIIPTDLLMSIAAGRQGVPFPALLEALTMTVVLEILQEAGLRLPKPIGQTIGIVGALIIGDAAVNAGLVSPLMVIIIGITAVASYAIPYYDLSLAVRLLRFPLMIMAGILGFFGVAVGLYALLIHVLSLRSFGVPYTSPMAPLRIRAMLQDTFVRAPWWALKRRPQLIDIEDPRSNGKG
ncbi:spore germination protein, GerA family [Desulfosporosinus orientis DSM 765]|uniref:Spore germination protein, GerA family n=1 Tax=Desulfosporosinus orientis (strain ATCC 19365 / DSM 765 / NCIMB 8382 / VKM B-1628 / Singapore I) TaxID=768706 RepID=G7W7B5_DESOD|nr:spore germination protein [Desulfosporosinus orientis]AET65786.1 spore germination protein, GerA family [Desulfosporosinus orientis DSM 765]